MSILFKPFYIMRHGQSLDNASSLISGAGSDVDLTDLGREQARTASALFLTLDPKPTRIVVSGLKRTHQTAHLVTGHVDYVVDPGLNERHLGDLDGKITEQQQKDMKTLPGEETSQDHATRVIAAINRHLEHDEVPLFVCHGGTVRRVMKAVNMKSKVSVGNAEIFYCIYSEDIWDMRKIET